jgi:hypothetical protein
MRRAKRIAEYTSLATAYFKTEHEARAYEAAMNTFVPRRTTTVQPLEPRTEARGSIAYGFKWSVRWENEQMERMVDAFAARGAAQQPAPLKLGSAMRVVPMEKVADQMDAEAEARVAASVAYNRTVK